MTITVNNAPFPGVLGNMLVILPPKHNPMSIKTQPPVNCEIPVNTVGSTLVNAFLLIILEMTVQKDAAIINISPVQNRMLPSVKLMAIIPQNPRIRPITLYVFNLSSLKNNPEKTIKTIVPTCFIIAVFEPSVAIRPI